MPSKKSVIKDTGISPNSFTSPGTNIPEPFQKAGRPIPVYWIRASRVTRGVDYSECNTKRGKSEKFRENSLPNLNSKNQTEKKTYKGSPDRAARQTIIDTINDIATHSRQKIAINPKTGKEFKFTTVFITLTLPVTQFHEDKIITNKVLKHFLRKLEEKHHMQSYIWKAEIQSKTTNNIHYHILTNLFINHRVIRRTWNECLERLGYISAYEQIHGDRNPPSTEIKKTWDVKNIAAYAAKYMAKDEKYKKNIRKVEGGVWGRSYNLANIKPLKIVAGPVLDQEFDMLIKNSNIRTSDLENCPYAQSAYFNIFKTDLKLYSAFQKAIKEEAIKLRSIIDPEPEPVKQQLFKTGSTFSETRTQQGFQKNAPEIIELKDKRRDNSEKSTVTYSKIISYDKQGTQKLNREPAQYLRAADLRRDRNLHSKIPRETS